jgi:hypothetical protein
LLPIAMASLALVPGDFGGAPSSFKAGTANVAAVWESDSKLHVRFTTDGSEQRYTGKVCAKEKVDGLVPLHNEGPDSIWIGPEGKCVWFKFWTRRGVDGFDVRAPGKLVFFDLRQASDTMPAERIWIGSGNHHPDHSPFTLQRE